MRGVFGISFGNIIGLIIEEVIRVVYTKDTKLDNLIKHYRRDELYAKVDSEDITLNRFTKKSLSFTIDFSDCDNLVIRYGKKIVLEASLVYLFPGILGMIAFFYAIQRGYNTVWMKQYDCPGSFFRMKAVSDKDSEMLVIQFEEDPYDAPCVQRFTVNKKITINNLKK